MEKQTSSVKGKKVKRLFVYIWIFLLVFFLIPLFNVIFLTDPIFSKFDNYHRLYNWDLKQHARGDYDGDGQEDLITFWGCAFLSSTNIDEISEGQRCISTSYNPDPEEEKIGQKYVQTNIYDLGLNKETKSSLGHSYLAKYSNQPWSIYIMQNGLRRFEIGSSGLLEEKPVTFVNKLDEVAYFISNWSILPFFIPFFFFIGLIVVVIVIVCSIIYFMKRNRK